MRQILWHIRRQKASPVITRNIFHQCHHKILPSPLSYIADINIHVKAICKCFYPCDLFITTGDNWFYLGKWSIILQQINLLSLSYRRIKSCFSLRIIRSIYRFRTARFSTFFCCAIILILSKKSSLFSSHSSSSIDSRPNSLIMSSLNCLSLCFNVIISGSSNLIQI